MSLFKEDNIFSASTNLTYGPHKNIKVGFDIIRVRLCTGISEMSLG